MKKHIILIYVLAVVIVGCIIYIFPTVYNILPYTYVAEYGNIQMYSDATCLVVRDETVVVSETEGKANRFIEEGELVKKNTNVIELNGTEGNNNKHQNPSVGVISYYIDGLESKLNSVSVTSISEKKFQEFIDVKVNEIPLNVLSGEPVFKVVDNIKWYVVTYLPIEDLTMYTLGSEVTLELPNDNIEGKVVDISQGKSSFRIVFETDKYYQEFAQIRSFDVRIIAENATGLLIRNSSLTEVEGVTGVYKKNVNDSYEFMPVQILVRDEKNSIITGEIFYDSDGYAQYTINPYDEIYKTPDDIDN